MAGDADDSETRKKERCSLTMTSVSGSVLVAFLAGFVHACESPVVKHMKNIHPLQLYCYRNCFLVFVILPHVIWRNENILGPPGSRRLACLRALVGSIAYLLQFIAVRYLPIGEATVIICSSPAFITIAARIFLKESLGLLQIISVVCTIVGMTFLSGLYETISEKSPVFTTDKIYGLVAALGSVLCFTFNVILMRHMKNIHHSVQVFMSGIMGLIEGAVIVLVFYKFQLLYRGLQQFFIIFIGICSYGSFSLFVIAVQNMDAGPSSTIIAASDIFFSFVFQVVFYHDTPNNIKILGAVLISLSVVLVGLRQQIMAYLSKMCAKFWWT